MSKQGNPLKNSTYCSLYPRKAECKKGSSV